MESSRIILITGASSGIGYRAALKMLELGNTVIAPCRNTDKSNYMLSRIRRDILHSKNIKEKLYLPILDLSNLNSINTFCTKLSHEIKVIDSLVLNAGLQYTGSKEPRWSFDGFELTFAVNHLGHQYLTQSILPLLYNSIYPRVIITSSEVHNPQSPGGKVGELADLGNLEGLFSGKGFKMINGSSLFNADKAYKDSKLCNILFSRELYKRLLLAGKNIPVLAWAPGLIIPRNNDGFFRYSRQYNEIGQRLFAFIARDLLKITETELNAGNILASLAIDQQYSTRKFSYRSNRILRPGKKIFEESEISKEAHNDLIAKRLWERCSELTKVSCELK